jgi:hypothetical protein
VIPRWLNAKDGSVSLNDIIRYTKGGFSGPGVPAGQTTPVIVIPAAASSSVPSVAPSVIVEAGSDEVAEIFSSMAYQPSSVNADVSARMSVLITDVAYRRRLMNRDVLVNHVFGSNLTPLFFRESTLLEAQQTMLFDFINNSVQGQTNLQFALEKRKFQATALSRKDVTDYIQTMRRRKMFLSPFWLTSDSPVTVQPGAVADVFFTVTDDIYAVLFANIASFIIDGTGSAGDTTEGFAVEFFDAKTERPLQNQPIARSCCSGTSGFPFVLPTGWIIEPNTHIHMRFTNLVTNNPIEIFWTFVGVSNFCNKNPLQYPEVDISLNSDASVGAP